jgi:acyl-CoA thioesterase I
MTGCRIWITALCLSLAACGSRDETPSESRHDAEQTSPAAASAPRASASAAEAERRRDAGRHSDAARDDRPRVVILGDSLTAGLGLPIDESYPALLQQRIDAAGLEYRVVNAGVSGDTSAGGLSRLDWALEGNVRVLVVALGGNDGLRGLAPTQLENNLAQIIERAQARRISVILAGMEAPPNYGREYIVAFHKVYPALARKYHVPLVPFLLTGVAGSETLNQSDGIHPTAAGARVVADNVWAVLAPVLEGNASGS